MILTDVYGLRIKPITGSEFVVFGIVSVSDSPDGLVYYCDGGSYPAEIVAAVHEEARETA